MNDMGELIQGGGHKKLKKMKKVVDKRISK